MGENTAPEKKITIKYKAFAHEGNYKNNYEYAEGTVVITLTKITPTGTPNYTPVTTEGKTLADVNLNGEFKDGDTVVPGRLEWVLEGNQTPEDVTVVKGARYAWKFTPDEDNSAIYEGLTGTIIPWTESGSGTVIIITPPEHHQSRHRRGRATGARSGPAGACGSVPVCRHPPLLNSHPHLPLWGSGRSSCRCPHSIPCVS